MIPRFHHEYGTRPRMLLAYADAAYASECGRYFRRLGWEVQMVGSGLEARAFADEYRPDVIVLASELLDESGWLTSAKISTANPAAHIILAASEWTPALEERARMVGAEQCVSRAGGAEALAAAILGNPVFSEAV